MKFLERQVRKTINVSKSVLSLDKNTKKWNGLKNAYKGKRAFLIGNGPSLNVTPLYLLKDEFTLCFNRFHLLDERLNWSPYFYMCIDPEVLPNISKEINSNLENFEYAIFHALHSKLIESRENVLKMHHVIQVPYFSERMPLFGSGGTVAYAGLQMLYYLGFEEIYLVGVDQNYVLHETAKKTSGIRIESQHDDDPNHFDPRYFGKGKRYHQPVKATQLRMIRAFKKAKEVAERRGISVKNAGIGGKLEVFDRVDFTSLFDYSQDQVNALFSSTISDNCKSEKVADFLTKSEIIEHLDESIDKDVFVTSLELAKRMIPKLITKYLTYGPIDNKYIFVKRDKKDIVSGMYFE